MTSPPPLTLNAKLKDVAIYRSIYQQIRDQILAGHLIAGARLPSSRSLAAELGCARGSVERAYELLRAEGFILGFGAAGTTVNSTLNPALIASRLAQSSEWSKAQAPTISACSSSASSSQPLPLQLGLPALDAFPRKRWNRLINKHSRNTGTNQLIRGSSFGYAPLRQALANYLAISRGVNAEPEEIFITRGFRGALAMITHCLATVGNKIWLEDPGYFHAKDCLTQLGMSIVPVPVDNDGMRIEAGLKLAPDAKFALLTPTHQAPMGVALSLPRRIELLNWAQAQQSWIIEDDYDSEFRYGEKPLPALKNLDANNRVIYIGSFSKVLAPSLNLAYLVVPKQLQPIFEQGFSSLGAMGSLLDQKVVSDFIANGHFSLHIKKMRKLYGERRAALVYALEHQLSDQLTLSLQAGGMNLRGELLTVSDESLLQKTVQECGLRPHFLSSFEIKTKHPPTLLLGFSNVQVASANEVVTKLAQAIKTTSSS